MISDQKISDSTPSTLASFTARLWPGPSSDSRMAYSGLVPMSP